VIVLSPFISVWRVGGEMLDELPDLDGFEHSDDRVGWSAMFDADFVLARRTFIGVDDRAVAEALVANGFESMGLAGYSRECCGDYDAVWADVQNSGTDRVVVELTAADSDWQFSWPLFSGFGSLMGLVGFGVLLTGRSTPRELEADPAMS
jgi:hypothetical protein